MNITKHKLNRHGQPRMNNKKHTRARVLYGYGNCNNVQRNRGKSMANKKAK